MDHIVDLYTFKPSPQSLFTYAAAKFYYSNFILVL